MRAKTTRKVNIMKGTIKEWNAGHVGDTKVEKLKLMSRLKELDKIERLDNWDEMQRNKISRKKCY